MIDLKAHLKTLTELGGPTGHESAILDAVRSAWTPLVNTFEVGKLGDLIAFKRGTGAEPRHSLLLCAHMDEIGLIVKHIDQGYLRLSRLGGIDPRTLPGQAVIVHGKRPLPGVVGLIPPLDPSATGTDYPKLADMWIDLGLPEAEVLELVSVGDIITMDAPLIDLAGKRVAGKALDDRVCIAVITGALDYLQGRTHAWDVIAVASTQEENGVSGAGLVAEQLRPTAAIALDACFAPQPGVSEGTFEFGAGVPVSLGANFHPALYTAILEAAERIEIETLPDPIPAHSGTDAWTIQIAASGIPVALINLQARNMHSTVETVDMGDVDRAARLLAEFIAGLTPEFIDKLTWGDES